MENLPEINQRIKDVVYIKAGGKVKAFAEMINVTQQSLNRLFNIDKRTGKHPNPLNTTIIESIQKTFNDIDSDWIRTGQGEMIKMEGKPLDENFQPRKDTVTQVSNDGYMEVEFRDLSVAAGPLSMTDQKAHKKTMLVPREYDKGEYLVVRVEGPSMEDGSIYSIPNGANILIKRIYLENGDQLPIRDNLYVIDAKDGQALKQIIEHNTEEGYIVCHSYNPEFNDYRVNLEDVFGFYIFRKIVGFRPPVRGI